MGLADRDYMKSTYYVDEKYRCEYIDTSKYRSSIIKRQYNKLKLIWKNLFKGRNNMAYWNWNGSVTEYIKFGVTLLIFRFIYENLEVLNGCFTRLIPVGWILVVILSIIILKQILWLLTWTNIWLKGNYKHEWLIFHWGIYLIIVSIIFSLKIY